MVEERTALILGGGGARGSYEAGVWKALREEGVEIGLVAGTSVGALNGLMVAAGLYHEAVSLWQNIQAADIFDIVDEKAPEELSDTDEFLAFAKEIILHKGAEATGLLNLLKETVREDAVRQSEMDYGLVVTEVSGLKGHYLFKEDIPTGLLHDYVVASASCFPAARYHNINGVDYIDGAYTDNLPYELARRKGYRKIMTVDLGAMGIVRKPNPREIKERGEEWIQIKPKWDLGSTLRFESSKMERNMRLGYLDCMKALGHLEGDLYAFTPGAFPKKMISRGDAAAEAFGLSPLEIYDETILIDALKGRVLDAQLALRRKSTPLNLLSGALRVTLMAERIRDSKRQGRLLGLDAIRPYLREVQAADFLLRHHLLLD